MWRWRVPRGSDSHPNVLRPTWSATYAPANSSPRSSNACGSAIAISRLASIPPISTTRTDTAFGSNQLVIHVV